MQMKLGKESETLQLEDREAIRQSGERRPATDRYTIRQTTAPVLQWGKYEHSETN